MLYQPHGVLFLINCQIDYIFNIYPPASLRWKCLKVLYFDFSNTCKLLDEQIGVFYIKTVIWEPLLMEEMILKVTYELKHFFYNIKYECKVII